MMDNKFEFEMEVTAFWGRYHFYKSLLKNLLEKYECEIIGYEEYMTVAGTTINFKALGSASNIQKVDLEFYLNK
jgi:hypothetical protein